MRRQYFVVKRETGFNQARGTGRGFGVTDIDLARAKHTAPAGSAGLGQDAENGF